MIFLTLVDEGKTAGDRTSRGETRTFQQPGCMCRLWRACEKRPGTGAEVVRDVLVVTQFS